MTDNNRAINLATRPEPSDPLDLTPLVRRSGGTMALRPIQSRALSEIAERAGGLLPIGVGHGKTLIALLAPVVLALALGRELRTLLLIPAAFRGQLEADREKLGQHFTLADPVVWSYTQLSQPESATALEQLQPDLIVCDEAHNLRHRTASRTKRVAAYLKARPQTHFVGMSGTLTTRSLLEYAHLAQWALGEGSPLPLHWTWLQSWAAVIDADGIPSPADFASVAPLVDRFGPPDDGATSFRDRARGALRERLRLTRGVVATHEQSARSTLVLRDRQLNVPAEVLREMRTVEETWEIPGGDVFDSPAMLAAVLRQLSCGFYYRWIWPGGKVDHDWLDARAGWAKVTRSVLAGGRPGLDSPALVARAVDEQPERFSGKIREARRAWLEQAHKPKPPRETVWISDFVVQDAVRWLQQSPGRVVWYASEGMGRGLERAGVRVHGEGTEAPDDGVRCACSIRVHGTGRNMQMYSEAYVVECPANGGGWEQLLGRLHRSGQEADPVVFEVLLHTEPLRSALAQADRDALYIESTQGQPQKLRLAIRTHVAPTEG